MRRIEFRALGVSRVYKGAIWSQAKRKSRLGCTSSVGDEGCRLHRQQGLWSNEDRYVCSAQESQLKGLTVENPDPAVTEIVREDIPQYSSLRMNVPLRFAHPDLLVLDTTVA